MATKRQSRRFDRRRTVRRNRPMSALVRSHRFKGARSENAFVQEMSSKGMRVISGIPLVEKDRVVLYMGEEKKPVSAQVVWARKEGIIEKRLTGKPGQAFVAGCVFVEEKPKKSPRKPVRQIKVSRKGAEYSNRLVRVIVIAAALGLGALLVNASFSRLSMLGG